MGMLYTVGHSTHTIDHFIDIISRHNINYILDVRSTPFSRYASTYNKGILDNLLKPYNITYKWMGKYFGARQEDKSLYHAKGYLDFEKVRASETFKKGYNNVLLGLESNNNIALMCAEKNPLDCHRTIMVARGFELNNIDVNHILEDGSLLNQHDASIKLTDEIYPNRNQMSIFSFLKEDNSYNKASQTYDSNEQEYYETEEEYISAAYRKRNEKIGFKYENLNKTNDTDIPE